MVLKADYFIFDMDGLMIDSEITIYNVWKRILEKYGYSVDMEFYKQFIGIPDHKMVTGFKERYGEDFPFEKLMKEHAILRDEVYDTEGVPFKYGLLELLETLKSKNKKMAVATSSPMSSVKRLLKRDNVIDYFDYFVTCEDVKTHKPEPEVFLKALELGGFKPEQAVVLEDSQNGLLASHRAGIRSIFIKDIIEPKKEVLDTVYLRANNLLVVSKIVE
ncbi:MAG: HAD family phosphatase [Tyzzerella sp.]|uniref:HAD family phosphatase n=1 Tax=Candidatus Fimicola merdigallinarum TaxID=2840819 RepID=A0A9D9DV52_9FIRM|nr:HAD family phosphatase [Candidatus Fimicola merdigallinarum]